MNNLCITGNFQSSVNDVAHIIKKTGVCQAIPACIHGEKFSIYDWHARISQEVSGLKDLPTALYVENRWKNLAEEILKANRGQELWYWVIDHMDTLDLWCQLDLHAKFMLVYTSPQNALLHSIQSGASTVESLHDTVQDWHKQTTHLLSFHRRHPRRSILIEDCGLDQDATRYVKTINRAWSHQLAEVELPIADAKTVAPMPIALAGHIIEKILQEQFPDTIELHCEALATVVDGKGTSKENSIKPEILSGLKLQQALSACLEWLHAYRFQHDSRTVRVAPHAIRNSHQNVRTTTPRDPKAYLNDANVQSHPMQGKSSESGEECEPNTVELNQTTQHAKRENGLLLEHLFDLQEEYQQQAVLAQKTGKQLLTLKEELSGLKAEKATLIKESTALAASLEQELHQLKEEKLRLGIELKKSLSQIQAQEIKIEDLTHEKARTTRDHEASTLESLRLMQSLENENGLLLSHFLDVQEELERQAFSNSNIEPESEGQCRPSESLLERDSINSTFSNVQVRTIPKNPESATEWRLNDICLENEHIAFLHFVTTLHGDLAGVTFLRSDTRSPTPFLRWPAHLAGDRILHCIPEKGNALHGRNAALSRLGTRDWKVLNLLVQHLATLLGAPVNTVLPETLDRHALQSGLIALKKALEKWPPILRYDSITLLNAKEAGSYRYLDLLLKNATLGNEKWPQLEYRFATLDSEYQLSVQTPRLEFTKATSSVLKSQFDKTGRPHSGSFELQLSPTNVKDNKVWDQLVAQDQILITWLVTTLPFQLADLRQTGAETSPDWTRVISIMREALKEHAIAPNSLSAN